MTCDREMCLRPVIPNLGYVDKFVACMLGDELADSREFIAMTSQCEWPDDAKPAIMGHYRLVAPGGCRYCFNGACFHPFRPGSMIGAIFADCFGRLGSRDADSLIDKTSEKAMEYRSCTGCRFNMQPYRSKEDSAFAGLQYFYRDMFEDVEKHHTLFSRDFDTFRKRYESYLKDPYWPEGNPLREYEDNIRDHFERMIRRHYAMMEEGVKDGGKELADARLSVIMELVMHWRYWLDGKFKSKEVDNV